jgi:hypothetical protein
MAALAYWRHDDSSAWNWSKFFCGPGITMTLGPLGTVAHPATASAAASGIKAIRLFMMFSWSVAA